jgi:hypothetical protein
VNVPTTRNAASISSPVIHCCGGGSAAIACVVEPVEQLVEVVGRQSGQARVVGAAGALLDHVAGSIGTPGRQEDRDVAPDVEHSRRWSERLPGSRTREPVPIPALEHVDRVRDNAGAEVGSECLLEGG